MAPDPAGRSSLPNFSYPFAPASVTPRENQKNYVFVDEHNRHKRLKVMRACEGCRRRKIKCDAATTNTWPCSACVRLKLNCVPPSVNYDKDFQLNNQTFDLDGTGAFDTGLEGTEDAFQPLTLPHNLSEDALTQSFTQATQEVFMERPRMYSSVSAPYLDPESTMRSMSYGGMPATPVTTADSRHPLQPVYSSSAGVSPLQTPGNEGAWRSDYNVSNNMSSLTEALGDLKIEPNAVAPYIANQKKSLAETPAIEEAEVVVPLHNSPDHIVAIPPEMMPSDQQANRYFEYFFANIHPYLPVINRSYFYQQWQKNRTSISPLILEAIFACSIRMLEDQSNADKWLALFSKHEESFRDVPRLSTIQAMILVLKAREGVPKRGYYYRSWMTLVNLVAMAKDLDLHEHFELHQMGKTCESNVYDCVTKTRVWHTLFLLEPMIGAPQGRSDLGVDIDTIDFSIPRPSPGLDEIDLQVSRQFAYVLRLVKNVSRSVRLHIKIRKTSKEWALDPRFVQHNAVFPAWPQDLPQHFQVHYPNDGSMPWIPSHFVANMHCYHHLGVIMQHRPQFHFLSERFDPRWRHHMVICYSAAKNMCRLQEAILQNYGLTGLACMPRGLGFTVYGVITCTMLHLVAITSPDPEFNTDARDYFTRHMRILEQCSNSWPLAEVQAQINSLREAFSADITKPFELKASFPHASPIVAAQPSPLISDEGYRTRGQSAESTLDQSGHYLVPPITPPLSASGTDPRADSPADQSLIMAGVGQKQPDPTQMASMSDVEQWNPTKIFEQWNTAFGTLPTDRPSEPSPPLKPGPAGFYNVSSIPETTQQGFGAQVSASPNSFQMSSMQAPLPSPVQFTGPPAPQYVTPSMWQEAVASSFGDGLKRRWDYPNTGLVDQSPKRYK